MAKPIISEHLSLEETSSRCNRTHQLKLWWVENPFVRQHFALKQRLNPTSKMKKH
jgi:hypothetical protein